MRTGFISLIEFTANFQPIKFPKQALLGLRLMAVVKHPSNQD